MSPVRLRHVGLRTASALAPVAGIASLLATSIAACAATDENPAEGDGGPGAILPSNDGGEEASPDASGPSDAAAIPCTDKNLCAVRSPLRLGSISAMSGRTKDDVWASGTGGLLLHWSGQKWSAVETSPDTASVNETISSVFLAQDEIWGVAGTLAMRRTLDPASLRTARFIIFGSLFRSLSGVAVLPNGDAYVSIAPGFKGMSTTYFAKLDFETKQLVYQPDAVHPLTNEPQSSLGIQALFLVPEKTIWLVGERGIVVRYPISYDPDGGAPLVGRGVVVPVASQANLLAAWGQGDHLWAAGTNGTVLHYDGTSWRSERTGTTVTLNAIFGLSSSDVWVAGEDGTVLHFDGTTWTKLAIGGTDGAYHGSLKSIWGSGPGDVWVGGADGFFHWGSLP